MAASLCCAEIGMVQGILATDVELIDHQHLEATEDISVHLFTLEEVRTLLENNEIMQSLNAAPLWKYMASL
jgi:ADP-ribose pyrophosphatase